MDVKSIEYGGEMTTALMDTVEYERSPRVKEHVRELLKFLRDRGGEATLEELLAEFNPQEPITPEQLGVVIDRAAARQKVDTSGLQTLVKILDK